MIQFNTRGKKSEPGLRKQLNIDVKSTTKFYFFFKYINMFIYFTNIRCFRFSILYFKYLQILILCATTFYKSAFYCNVFRRRLKSRNIKMVKVSYVLHYKCLFLPKFNKLSKFFPVVWFVAILYGVLRQNMKQFISWAIIKRLTESESILLKRGIEAHFRARLQP